LEQVNTSGQVSRSSSKIRKGIGILSITGLIDYTLEFLKTIILAGYFGITAQVDAYYSGKSVPDLFISFTAGSAHGATLPNYPTQGSPEREKSRVMISALVSIGGFGLIAFSLGAILADQVSRVFFVGLEGENIIIASRTMAMLFIAGFFRIIVSILRSYYEHVYQFLIPAVLDLLLSLLPIIFVLLLGDQLGVLSLPLGFLGASILIAFFLFVGIIKQFDIHWSLSLDFGAIRRILTLIPPLALGSLAYKINAVIDRIFASGFVVGSISSLQYGYNPLYIIHAVVFVPFASALFPVLSQKILANDLEGLRRLTTKSLRLLMPLNLWGLWILLFFRNQIISLLYGRGAFDARAVEMTSTALLFYSFGFVVFSANSLFLKVMMSAQDRKGLYTLGVLSIGVNVVGDWVLGYYFQMAGIALTTSLVHFTWAVVAYLFIRKKIGNFISRKDLFFILNLTIISFLSVFLSYLGASWLVNTFLSGFSAFLNNLFILFLGSTASVVIFFIALYLLDIPEIDLFLVETKKIRLQLVKKVIARR
jgi:putative peptidoglycan lipid II flippase